ncbi:40S ribosomal protein S11 [Apteryx rowi]|nr:40S ribosomal protein S11 [Apteryx rowi]
MMQEAEREFAGNSENLVSNPQRHMEPQHSGTPAAAPAEPVAMGCGCPQDQLQQHFAHVAHPPKSKNFISATGTRHEESRKNRLSPQTERAYQKQPTIFQNKKRVLLGEGGKEKLPRYYKNIGLGFKTPKEAIEGTYIDKKCPFTGNVSIRGRILSGVVTKMKMQRTIVIRRDYLHYIRKYNRFEKRHKNMSVHLSPCFRDVQIGDIVTVGECRPLSKTVRFNVLKVTKAAGTKKQFQKF